MIYKVPIRGRSRYDRGMRYAPYSAALIALCLLAPAAQAGPLREMIMERRAEKANHADLPNVAYGPDPKQALDVYKPANATHAPMIVMVHGGAWRIGDKAYPGVADTKAAYWVPKGYLLISVNYRLLPDADVATQAADVGRALAYIEQHAGEWGGDANRLVLMGHSAGAHLVALLSANPSPAQGARPWRGTVVLDSAAMNVPAIMNVRHMGFYDDAFGQDPSYWTKLSPIDQLTPQAVPMMLVCSTERKDKPCLQAEGFAARAKELGFTFPIHGEALSHAEINHNLGTPSAYTDAVDSFITSVLN